MSGEKAETVKRGNRGAGCFILLAGSMWGLMGLLVRSLTAQGLDSMEICFARSIVACIGMLVVVLLFDRRALKIRLRDIWCFIGTGACSVAFFNFCYFRTITLTSLSVAAVLLYTAPAFVMLLSAILFHEKISFQKVVALVLAFTGCAFVAGIIGGDSALSLQGIIVGLGAGFGYALYSIFSRYALERKYSSMTISFYTFFFCSVATAYGVDTRHVFQVLSTSWQLEIKTVLLVILVTLLPYLCYTKGLQGMENGAASVLASIEPVVATLIGIFIYKEKMSVWNSVGICLVLGSIAFINFERKPT